MTEAKKVEGPKIHKADIDAILTKSTFEINQPEHRTATHVNVYDEQGYFLASGFSACVDPSNFDADIGKQNALSQALGNAETKLWQLEGYHLKKQLEAGRYILTQEDKLQPLRVQRQICERNDLMRNFSLCTAFIEQGCPGVVDTAEVDLLREQAAAMFALIEILDKRLALVGLT